VNFHIGLPLPGIILPEAGIEPFPHSFLSPNAARLTAGSLESQTGRMSALEVVLQKDDYDGDGVRIRGLNL